MTKSKLNVGKAKIEELYNLLDEKEKKIVLALAIKKSLNKNLTPYDILCMFVAEKMEKNQDQGCIPPELYGSLKTFISILKFAKTSI